MNKSLEVLKKIYKPYRYTIKGKATILSTTSGDFVVKEKNSEQNIRELFSYLNSRNFTNFPSLVDDARNDINVYEYLESVPMPSEQKFLDMIDIISNLHNQTTFYKSVTEDNFKEIYDNIKSNIDYLNFFYNDLYEKIKKDIYMSPSNYLFIRNAYKIFASLSFCGSELDKWYEMVRNQDKKRVSLIHNNLCLDHFLKNEKAYFISWDNARIDTPILDLVKFYQCEYFNANFEHLISRYFEKVRVTDDEKKLFFILISLPKKIELNNNEYEDCQMVREALDYLFITEKLVRPYYAVEQEN